MASIINTKNLTIAKNLLDNRIIRKENIFPKRKFKSEADCYKCGRIGHYANKYYTQRKLKEFQIDEGLKLQLSNYYLILMPHHRLDLNTKLIMN